MACACNRVSISGKHSWEDNTRTLLDSDEISNSFPASGVFSHQGGQRGQVHADGDDATGEAELAELGLSLG